MEKKKAAKTSILHFEVSRDNAGVCVNITLKCKAAFCSDDVALRGNGGKPFALLPGIKDRTNSGKHTTK